MEWEDLKEMRWRAMGGRRGKQINKHNSINWICFWLRPTAFSKWANGKLNEMKCAEWNLIWMSEGAEELIYLRVMSRRLLCREEISFRSADALLHSILLAQSTGWMAGSQERVNAPMKPINERIELIEWNWRMKRERRWNEICLICLMSGVRPNQSKSTNEWNEAAPKGAERAAECRKLKWMND